MVDKSKSVVPVSSLKKISLGTIIIKNDRGLHTRPSTEIVKCAMKFKSEIYLFYQNSTANAKSLLGILMLSAVKGAKIKIEAKGDDSELAIKSLVDLSKKNFNIHY